MMSEKGIKFFGMMMAAGVIGMIGICIGAGYTRKQIERAEQKEESVTLIAVVDLDEGVLEEKGKRFYAAELMDFPDNNFKWASLEEARSGILNGTFGAYVVIPASFSESVDSLNYTPLKTSLTYAINPNLSDETYFSVNQDVKLFYENLRERVSYMYVTSILAEFHDVQDESEIILENDVADLGQIEQINAEDLAKEVEVSELKMVEGEWEYLDLSQERENNMLYLQEIIDIYTKAQEMGDEQLKGLSDGMENIRLVKDELDETVRNFHFMENDEGELVIQDEMDALDEELLLTQESREQYKKDLQRLIRTNLYHQEENYQNYVNECLHTFQNSEQERFDEWYEELKDQVVGQGITLPEKFMCMEGMGIDLSEKRSRRTPEEEFQTEEEKEIATFALDEELQEQTENLLFVSDDVVRIIKQQIEPKVITILTDGCDLFKEKLEGVDQSVTDYLGILTEYKPLENLDQEGLSDSLQNLNENITDMETRIQENQMEEWEYVNEIYETTDENVNNLKDDIIRSNEETILNVSAAVAQLQENRKNINTYNQEILGGFATKLPYSRLGNLENRQVNSYVVSPITCEEIVMDKSLNEKLEENFDQILLVLMGAFGACFLAFTIWYFYPIFREKRIITDNGLSL